MKLREKIGPKFMAVPIMCMAHSNERRYHHLLTSLNHKIFGSVPKNTTKPHNEFKSLEILNHNFFQICKRTNFMKFFNDSMKSQDQQNFEYPKNFNLSNSNYTGTDSISKRLHKFSTSSSFDLNTFKAPIESGVRWKGIAINLQQIVAIFPFLIKFIDPSVFLNENKVLSGYQHYLFQMLHKISASGLESYGRHF